MATRPDGRKVKATLHWVSARDALPAEVRLYSTLFNRPDPGAGGDLDADLNPASLEVLSGALVEPSLTEAAAGQAVQFERLGYFCADLASRPNSLVFNRTIEPAGHLGKGSGPGLGVAIPRHRTRLPAAAG